jgi:NAD(P)-dependent dehydrogenase (short-subunit alcohol dehydrogenase family)
VSSGIGFASAQILLEQGAFVFGVDIAPSANAEHERLRFLSQDLTAMDAPEAVVAECQAAFGGRIDALLNIAGVMDNCSSVATISDLHWEHVMAINVTAPVRLMREVTKVMRKQKSGSIANVSSKAGISGAVAGVAYTASKHALVSSDVQKNGQLDYQ